MWVEGKGSWMNMYLGPMDKTKAGIGFRVRGRDGGRGREGESDGGKIETTVFEHQFKKINHKKKKKRKMCLILKKKKKRFYC